MEVSWWLEAGDVTRIQVTRDAGANANADLESSVIRTLHVEDDLVSGATFQVEDPDGRIGAEYELEVEAANGSVEFYGPVTAVDDTGAGEGGCSCRIGRSRRPLSDVLAGFAWLFMATALVICQRARS